VKPAKTSSSKHTRFFPKLSLFITGSLENSKVYLYSYCKMKHFFRKSTTHFFSSRAALITRFVFQVYTDNWEIISFNAIMSEWKLRANNLILVRMTIFATSEEVLWTVSCTCTKGAWWRLTTAVVETDSLARCRS